MTERKLRKVQVLGEHVTKLVVEIVQAIALISPIGLAFTPAQDKEIWLPAAIAGVVCVYIWKILQIFHDILRKKTDAKAIGEADEYNRQATIYAALIGVLCASVQRKVKRLKKVIKSRNGTSPQISQVRTALTPEPHLEDLLDVVCQFYRGQLSESDKLVKNFRVGVYVSKNGYMTPVQAVECLNSGSSPFTAPQNHIERFHLDSGNPSVVVRAVKEKKMIVVENCEESEKLETFAFFTDHQRGYLKSIVCFYMGGVYLDDRDISSAVLCMDTNVSNFFKESEAESDLLQYCLHEFSTRIKLELMLQTLIEK